MQIAYIHFKCSACGKHLEIEEKGAGMSVPCTDCGDPVAVPRFPSPHECSYCRTEVLVADYLQGSEIQCPNCDKMFFVRLPTSPNHANWQSPHPPNTRQNWPTEPPERLDLLTKGGQWLNREKTQEDAECREMESCNGKSDLDGLIRDSKNITGILFVIGVLLVILGMLKDLKALSVLGIILWFPGVLYLCSTDIYYRITLFTAFAWYGYFFYVIKVVSGVGIGIFITSFVPVLFAVMIPVLGAHKQIILTDLLAEIKSTWPRLSLLFIVVILLFAACIRNWGFNRNAAIKQQGTDATAGSGQKVEWVNGVPKASQTEQQARHERRKTGKKYTGLDGQESFLTIEINNGTLIYRNPITENQSSALARFLVPIIFDGTKTGIVLSYSDGYYIIGKNASEETTNIDGFHKTYALIAREVSNQVFGGKPVKICFFDKEMNILVEISDSEGKKEFKEYQKTLAYQSGFEYGVRMGKLDRQMATYDHISPDSPKNFSFYQLAHLAGCDFGTPEYADFADGYDMGYRSAR
jgi:DNA-directed RNA polymerase subunit RPC12/RpoP